MALDPWHLDVLIPLALAYALSVWGFFAEQALAAQRLASVTRPMRSRPRISTRVQDDGGSVQAA